MKKVISGRSAGASVAVQAAKRRANNGQPINLSTERLEHGSHPKTGCRTLHAVFAQAGGIEPSRIDISFMLDFPNLTELFAAAFLAYGSSVKPGSARTVAGDLKLGFFAFVRNVYGENLKHQDISDELLIAFRTYINSVKGRQGKPVALGTIRGYMGSLRVVLGSLKKGTYKRIAQSISERVPAGPVGTNRTAVPTPVLSMDELLQIMEAAEREFFAIEARFRRGQELVESGREKILMGAVLSNPNIGETFELDVVLASLNIAYPGIIPPPKAVLESDETLARAMDVMAKKNDNISLSRYFYPSSRDLVCFALLITIVAVFNPDTALWLKWSNVSLEKDVAGVSMVEIIGEKDRAEDNLVRLLDPNDAVGSQLSLSRLLKFLSEFTSRARPFVLGAQSDFLFIFVQDSWMKNPKSWGRVGGTHQGPSNDSVWQFSLKQFILDNKLSRFTLSQLRPTILNLVQSLDGSLEAAATVGNHKSLRTTWTHYTSDGIRKEYRERIGQVMLLRERWFNSSGQIDPRIRRALTDKGAATPGFMCVDPFDSPRPNQFPGRLCNDYGGCPACPLAGAYPDDPDSVAYYTALVDAIYRSQGGMSSQTWLKRWTPVLSDLRALLSLVSVDVMNESNLIAIRLPLVG